MAGICHTRMPGLAACVFSAQAHASRTEEADASQPRLAAIQPDAPVFLISNKDAVKALDATIVAIGIVAVLIVNVAYVGAAPSIFGALHGAPCYMFDAINDSG